MPPGDAERRRGRRGRPRDQQLNGAVAALVHCLHQGAAEHDQQRPLQALVAQASLQVVQVGADRGSDVGAYDRRRKALELPQGRHDLVRADDVGVWTAPVHDLAGEPFVLRLGVGVQEADRDRLASVSDQLVDRLLGRGLVQ